MSLHHVALECREDAADAEVAFWALLGFTEVALPATLAGRARWVQREGTQIHVMYADAPVVAPDGHVAIVAADYDATQQALREAGHEVADREPHWGAARCCTWSPAGHRVEVMAAPPA